MDWVPLFFIDAVCHQMKLDAFKQVSELTAGWAEFGAEHREKRRELAFFCNHGHTTSYSLEDRKDGTELVVADLNSEFDRITLVKYSPTDQLTNWVSLEELKRDVFPTVASLAANCYWPYLNHLSPHNLFFFKAFKNCPGFNDITVKEHGRESRDFIARQVELGNVHTLHLLVRESVNWPEPEDLAETLKTFVNSPRFHYLIYHGSLPNDIELFELFLERAIAGELKPGAYISLDNIALEKSQRIKSLRPECREASKEIAWRIPNSNRRVVVEEKNGISCMEVKRSVI